jgi:hypothetical protein
MFLCIGGKQEILMEEEEEKGKHRKIDEAIYK